MCLSARVEEQKSEVNEQFVTACVFVSVHHQIIQHYNVVLFKSFDNSEFSFSLSLVIHLFHPLCLTGPTNYIQCLHRAGVCQFFSFLFFSCASTCRSPYKMLLISSSLLFHLSPAYFVHLTWMVCEIGVNGRTVFIL